MAQSELEDWGKTRVMKARRRHEVEEMQSDKRCQGVRREWVKLRVGMTQLSKGTGKLPRPPWPRIDGTVNTVLGSEVRQVRLWRSSLRRQESFQTWLNRKKEVRRRSEMLSRRLITGLSPNCVVPTGVVSVLGLVHSPVTEESGHLEE